MFALLNRVFVLLVKFSIFMHNILLLRCFCCCCFDDKVIVFVGEISHFYAYSSYVTLLWLS
jgi:hypothetical protein